MTQKVKNLGFHLIEILLIGVVAYGLAFLITTNSIEHSTMNNKIDVIDVKIDVIDKYISNLEENGIEIYELTD